MKYFILFFLAFILNGTGFTQGENLALTAPNITGPMPAVVMGQSGVLSFTVFNINGQYTPECGATITITMTDIAPLDGANSVTSSSKWSWAQNENGTLVGTLVSNVDYYFENIMVDVIATADSADPLATNGFTALVDAGSCANSNTIDNMCSAFTFTEILEFAFINFDAILDKHDGDLSWSVENNYNTSSFNIYRSFDNDELEVIGTVDGDVFEYVDSKVFQEAKKAHASIINYQVEQVDNSGTTISTEIESINLIDTRSPTIVKDLVYPNPATTQIQFNLPNTDDEYLISIYNELGQIVKVTKQKVVDVNNLSEGLYAIEVVHINSMKLQTELLVIKR